VFLSICTNSFISRSRALLAHVHKGVVANNRQLATAQTVDKKCIYWIFVMSKEKCERPLKFTLRAFLYARKATCEVARIFQGTIHLSSF
ncbi:MAG: hypothetical protein ACRCV4_03680, partial [Hafnia alvei]